MAEQWTDGMEVADRGHKAAWVAILAVLGLLLLAAGCAGDERPRRPTARPTGAWPSATRERPQPVTTLRPTLVPIPTLSPLQIQSRSLATPEAPVLVDYRSYVTNARCFGECLIAGDSSLYATDFMPYWEHPDPVSADYYEVWRATQDPYWDIATCTQCSLVGVSTGMTTTIPFSPAPFNPVGGTSGSEIMTPIDFYVVRAVNGAGASAQSNMIGVVHYSLLQGGDFNMLVWPRPTPTLAP